jgi:uncharacterized protein (TIGR03067 family)
MKVTHFILACAVSVLTACSTMNRSAEKSDQLAGTWTCVSATVDGRPLPEATVKQLRLTLTTDRYKTEKGTEVLFDSTYTIDSSKNPKEINIVGTEGDLAGKAAQGIFSLQDDALRICYTMPGKQRPAAFDSPPGSEIYLLAWTRSKP